MSRSSWPGRWRRPVPSRCGASPGRSARGGLSMPMSRLTPMSAWPPFGRAKGLPTGACRTNGWSRPRGSGARPGAAAGRSCAFTMSPVSSSTASTPTPSRITPCRPCAESYSFACRGRAPGSWQRLASYCVAASSSPRPVPRPFRFQSAPSPRGSQAGLLVDGRGRVEDIGSVWDNDRILGERRRPHLRQPLRLISLALGSLLSGSESSAARFVSELAAGQAARGHEVHVLVPATDSLPADQKEGGVHYHALNVPANGCPLERARAFGRAAASRLQDLAPPDLLHLHDWMAALGPRCDTPTILSLSSIEATRRNGAPPSAPVSGD